MAVLGLSTAFGASSYRVTLYRASSINGTELKAGDVKVEVNGDKVLIKQGKTSVEAPVKIETRNTKFDATSVGYNSEGTNQIQEIRLGGTTTMLKFEPAASAVAAGGSR